MAQLKAEIKKLETLMEQSRAVVMVRNGWDTKKRACAAEGRAKAGEAGSRGEFETMNAHVIALETSVRNKTEVKEVCAKFDIEWRRLLQRELRVERESGTMSIMGRMTVRSCSDGGVDFGRQQRSAVQDLDAGPRRQTARSTHRSSVLANKGRLRHTAIRTTQADDIAHVCQWHGPVNVLSGL